MKYFLLTIIIGLLSFTANSQELEAILEKESANGTELVLGSFNGTRLLNGHSIETRKKGVLEFLISHRFDRVNSGFDEFFGLDDSNIRFAFEYAFNDRLTLAVGRSSFEKTYDGYVKYRLIRQKTGKKASPISATLFGSMTIKTIDDFEDESDATFGRRLSYTSQILIARKFNQNFSFQLAPTFIHFNRVNSPDDPHNMFALGAGTRVKISKRVSLNGEYYYNLNPFESRDVKNSIAFGVDIETGGHIFQLIFTNAVSMIEKGFIAETTGDFFKGDIHFGFNISRAFQVSKAISNEQ
ncbi:hypothetical protein GWK08_08380 [Leptobacterium flavescens]|uniref:DUF5777 domain-containing protein n=1 Tax=Leptobacterium flavescens TaxID=472055 RepID=A0A6P0UNM1_9FLAO|nr:DUF5777 family beta-barrel protein [Leptobacterium flavescens]NER13449.1 hypothetical protein [Leptobacterium flavescens]